MLGREAGDLAFIPRGFQQRTFLLITQCLRHSVCETRFRKRAFSPSLSAKEGQMPHVFPDITNTLLSTDDKFGSQRKTCQLKACDNTKAGLLLERFAREDVGFGRELELFSAQILRQSWEGGGSFCYCYLFLCDLVFYIL